MAAPHRDTTTLVVRAGPARKEDQAPLTQRRAHAHGLKWESIRSVLRRARLYLQTKSNSQRASGQPRLAKTRALILMRMSAHKLLLIHK